MSNKPLNCEVVSVEMPCEEWQRYIRDKKIEYHRDIYGFASAYDNIIMLAGYAAFFTLWSGISQDISQAARAITVVGLGLSLTSYIVWQLRQMISRQRWEFRRAEAFAHQDNPEKFNDIWDTALEKFTEAQNRDIQIWWAPMFGASVVLGVGSAIFLVTQAIALILNLPRFTGHL